MTVNKGSVLSVPCLVTCQPNQPPSLLKTHAFFIIVDINSISIGPVRRQYKLQPRFPSYTINIISFSCVKTHQFLDQIVCVTCDDSLEAF